MLDNEKNTLRIIPLTDEFMRNKSIYDKIWAYLQLNSYVNKDNRRFVYSGVIENKALMYSNILNAQEDKDNIPFCYDTFIKAFNLLLEPTEQQLLELANETNIKKKEKLLKKMPIGYISKGKTTHLFNNEECDCYYLKEDFDVFKLIPKDTLEYLYITSNNNVIKIYVYLLNCYSYKKSCGDSELYLFTKEELSKAIGYTSKSFYKNIDYILESLESCGLIKYHKVKKQISKTTFTFYYALDAANLTRTNKKTFSNDISGKEFIF